MENKIQSLHHISLKSTAEKFPQVLHFYKDILGLEIFRQWSEGVLLKIGNNFLEIFNNAEEEWTDGNIRHFALCVDDVDQWAKKLSDEGFEIFMGPKDICFDSNPQFKGRVVFCKGPLGESVEFFQEEKFVIKDKTNFDDRFESDVFILNHTGILKQKIKSIKIFYFTCLLIALVGTVFSFILRFKFLAISLSIYSLYILRRLIFVKKDYIARYKKNMKKNFEIIKQQTGIPYDESQPSEVIFKYDSIEYVDKIGESKIFNLKDFVQIIDSDKSYIMEFTNGRFLFCYKKHFESKEELLSLLRQN